MIRKVTLNDVRILTDIYNGYIENSDATFETEQISEEEMKRRVLEISSDFPYCG